jgi:Amt family ammonium transporter
MKLKVLLSSLLALLGVAFAQEINAGDTAWMLTASALVLLMTPGLAFFYGGLARGKSVLNTMLMSFVAMGIVGVLWVVVSYSIAFGDGGNAWIGSLSAVGLNGLVDSVTGTIPTLMFVIFQAMFAIITPALISGAVVDRMKFSSYVIFITLWSVLIYAPLAHWVWSADGWLFNLGALDFAGGTVVHMSAGFSALVAAWLLGPRLSSTRRVALPHNIPFVLLGAGLLWFGWFGFNAGSALAANSTAALAFVTTNTAAAAAMITWLICEGLRGHKPTAVGAATGAVVGLVTITPAAAFVSPLAAIAVGAIGAAVAFGVVQLKNRIGIDDALDVFACGRPAQTDRPDHRAADQRPGRNSRYRHRQPPGRGLQRRWHGHQRAGYPACRRLAQLRTVRHEKSAGMPALFVLSSYI